MNFKLVLLSVACFAVYIQPAQSGSIGFAIVDSVKNIATLGTNLLKSKIGMAVRAGTGLTSILPTAMGLKFGALAKASGSLGGAVSNGIVAIGEGINNVGASLTGSTQAGGTSFSTGSSSSGQSRFIVRGPVAQEIVEKIRMNTPTVVEQDIAVPYKQVVAIPSESINSLQLRIREPAAVVESARIPFVVNEASMRSFLRNAAIARSKFNGLSGAFSIGGVRRAGAPFVYEIANSRNKAQKK